MKKILFSIITLMMVLVPLVNAEEKVPVPDDQEHYATVENGSDGGFLGTDFKCTNSNNKAVSTAACNGEMSVKLAGAAGERTAGYWYGVVVKMPTSSDVNLEKSILKVDDKEYKINDILDGKDSPKWVGIWNKVDEIKKAVSSGIDERIYTFEWHDQEDKTYTQTLTISVDYSQADITESGTEEGSGADDLYKVTVDVTTGAKASKEIIYFDHSSETKLSELKEKELQKFMEPASGYKFKWFAKKDSQDTELGDDTVINNNDELIAVFEKIPSSSGSTSTTTPDPEPTPEPEDKPADKDNTPKTGNTDLVRIASMVMLLSLAGIVTLKKSM